MVRFWSLFTTFIITHIVVWIQAPRLPFPKLIAEKIEISHFFSSINKFQLIESLGLSLIVGLFAVVICLFFTIGTATLLTRTHFPFKKQISLLLYMPLLAPILLPSIGLYYYFSIYDLSGSIFAIALAQSAVLYPYMLKPIEDHLVKNGDKFEQIAYSLGASRIETFFKVTLISLKAPIGIGSFFVFVGSFNDYIISFLIGDFQINTLAVHLYPLMQSDNRLASVLVIIIYTAPLILLAIMVSLLSKRKKNARA